MRQMFGALMVATAMTLIACGGGEHGGGPADSGVGVKECDDYIAAFHACLPKLPEAGRDTLNKALDAQTEGFKQTAATPEGKSSLVGTCNTLLENLKKNPACQ
ncbi:MAG: hypothetical protein KIT14_09855 [bacterium]|nr:hypothetical protein [bacterium]